MGKSGEGGKSAFLKFWTKWPPAAILDVRSQFLPYQIDKQLFFFVRYIWMNNACVKFEERSLNPSKVIALTTKL